MIDRFGDLEDEICLHYDIELKYGGYIRREQSLADKVRKNDKLQIPAHIDFSSITSISTEGRQKLTKYHPKTLGDAKKISGLSPSDLNGLLITIHQHVNKGAK
jgi:tRNA uridine 5-carboxymethylaminomethyl modification enzyme